MEFGEEFVEDLAQGADNALHPNYTKEERAEAEEADHEFSDTFNDNSFFNEKASDIGDSRSCKKILYANIFGGGVRAWDLLILIPTAAFLFFLLLRFRHARLKLGATNSPIFRAFYALVFVSATVGVVRCLVSMTVSAADPVGGNADKTLWILLRFILLSTEMCVLVFGLAAGHLESRAAVIRRVVLATALISGAFSALQAVMEFGYPDKSFHVESRHLGRDSPNS
jgi:hypothetical protein